MKYKDGLMVVQKCFEVEYIKEYEQTKICLICGAKLSKKNRVRVYTSVCDHKQLISIGPICRDCWDFIQTDLPHNKKADFIANSRRMDKLREKWDEEMAKVKVQ